MKRFSKIIAGTLSVCAILAASSSTAFAEDYTDISGHWAEAEIRAWSDEGILKGSDGKFRPDDPIRRAEMAVIIDRFMGYEDKSENTFSDVEYSSWYADSILRANHAGVILGYGDTVRPMNNITRQDAIVMLCRAFGIEASEGDTSFADDSDIADYAKGYVKTLTENSLAAGVGDNKFSPRSNITRAAVIKLLDNIVNSDFYTAELPENAVVINDVSDFEFVSGLYTVKNNKITSGRTASDNSEQKYGAAFINNEHADFTADITIRTDKFFTAAGLIFRAAKAADYDGFEGYALMVRDRTVYFYDVSGNKDSGMTFTELGYRNISRDDFSSAVTLRVECAGDVVRGYYLDDMPGIEPWPEFEFTLTGHKNNTGIGVVDNGQGAVFSKFTLADFTPKTLSGETFVNPVIADGADPSVLYYDGMYYLYSTNYATGYKVFTSPDLVHWTDGGVVISDVASVWELDSDARWSYWAPEVIEHNGTFYMAMTVDQHVGFATAKSPSGPFVAEPTYVFDHAIDAHIFIDDDGKAYLYVESGDENYYDWVLAYELNDDIVTLKDGVPHRIIKPTSTWERLTTDCTEGPFVLKHNGYYYITYSGDDYKTKNYSIGVAVSDNPLEGFERVDYNPILNSTYEVYGPGHHSFLKCRNSDEYIIAYHKHVSTEKFTTRDICIGRARFSPTKSGVDRLEIYVPTFVPQEYLDR